MGPVEAGEPTPQSLPTAVKPAQLAHDIAQPGRARAARGGEWTECAALLCVSSGERRSRRAAARHSAEPAFGEPRRSARRPVSNHQNPPTGPNYFCRNRQASLGPRRGTYVAAEGDVGGKAGAYWSSGGAARLRLES